MPRGPAAAALAAAAVLLSPTMHGSHGDGVYPEYPGSVIYDTPASADGAGLFNHTAPLSYSQMPLGNGEISVSLWVEAPHSIAFYVGRSDSYDELHRLIKVTRVRVRFGGLPTHPFPQDGQDFSEVLHLQNATVQIRGAGGFRLSAWVDANAPHLHLSAACCTGGDGDEIDFTALVTMDLMRSGSSQRSNKTSVQENGGCNIGSGYVATDVILPSEQALGVYHRNGGTEGVYTHDSLWESELRLQGLGSLVDNPPHGMPPDPLTNSTFGAAVVATHGQQHKPIAGWNRTTMQIDAADGVLSFGLVSRLLQTDTAAVFEKQLSADAARLKATDLGRAYAAHEGWWERYWSQSYIRLSASTSPPLGFNASLVAWQVAIQRYLSACEGRGPGIIKFNGGIFVSPASLLSCISLIRQPFVLHPSLSDTIPLLSRFRTPSGPAEMLTRECGAAQPGCKTPEEATGQCWAPAITSSCSRTFGG